MRISTDSITVDTTVYVYTAETSDSQFEFDGDSGGGLIDAELVFQAPHSGEFFIAVADVWGEEFGGYYPSVERAADST